MIKIAVCDDDIAFTGTTQTFLDQIAKEQHLELEVSIFLSGKSLVQEYQEINHFDLIFLDIEMKRINGIKAAHAIRGMDRSVLLIYVSGYEQYLKELFEVEPFRFLQKPLNDSKFRRYFHEACDRIGDMDSFYQFNFNKNIHRVSLRDTVYFESRNRVVYIIMDNGTEKYFYGKLNDVEKQLKESRYRFLRIHQSYLVNYR